MQTVNVPVYSRQYKWDGMKKVGRQTVKVPVQQTVHVGCNKKGR